MPYRSRPGRLRQINSGGKAPSVQSTMANIAGWLSSSIKKISYMFGITGASLLVWFMPFFEPLKNDFLHWIYPEKVDITLDCGTCVMSLSQPISIIIHATPDASTPVEKGFLKLDYDRSVFVLSKDTPGGFNTAEIAESRMLNEGRFVLYPKQIPEKEYQSTISITLKTKYGEHRSNKVIVTILPSEPGYVTPFLDSTGNKQYDLSGEWIIEIDGKQGQMQISQNKKAKITGKFSLGTTERGTEKIVDGFKDGTTFRAWLYRSADKTKAWRVEGPYITKAETPNLIEITSACAWAVVADRSITQNTFVDPIYPCKARNFVGWRNTSYSTFYAVARTQP